MVLRKNTELAGLDDFARIEMNERISDATGCSKINDEKQWFVMRDLTRSNAKHPAYRMLEEKGLTYFTPMTWKIVVKGGRWGIVFPNHANDWEELCRCLCGGIASISPKHKHDWERSLQ